MDTRVLALMNASDSQGALVAGIFAGVLIGVAACLVIQVLAERRHRRARPVSAHYEYLRRAPRFHESAPVGDES